jgi:hypothetical protein
MNIKDMMKFKKVKKTNSTWYIEDTLLKKFKKKCSQLNVRQSDIVEELIRTAVEDLK